MTDDDGPITDILVAPSILDDVCDGLSPAEDLVNDLDRCVPPGSQTMGFQWIPTVASPLYAACVQNLDLDAFLRRLQTIDWTEPERLQVFVQDGDDGSPYREIRPFASNGH